MVHYAISYKLHFIYFPYKDICAFIGFSLYICVHMHNLFQVIFLFTIPHSRIKRLYMTVYNESHAMGY